MAYNDLECNVKREALGVYTNQVIIQHHDSVVTSSDLGLALHCQYDLGNKSVGAFPSLMAALTPFSGDQRAGPGGDG
jgi:hypothetical protein